MAKHLPHPHDHGNPVENGICCILTPLGFKSFLLSLKTNAFLSSISQSCQHALSPACSFPSEWVVVCKWELAWLGHLHNVTGKDLYVSLLSLQKHLHLPSLSWEKQVVLQNAESVPGDQDVEEEANMIKNSWEDLCKKNPLVLKELSKVKSDVA